MLLSGFLFYILSIVKCDKKSLPILFFSSWVYAFLIAFKGESGSDTYVYKDIFDNVLSSTYYSFPFKEFGSYILFYGLRSFNFSFDYINYINAFFVFFSLILLALKRSPILVIIYIAFVGINVDFSTIRQSYAIHIFTVFFLISDRLYVSMLSGLLFHYSSIIVLAVDKLKNKLDVRKVLVFIVVLCVLLVIFLERYLISGMDFIVRKSPFFLLQSFIIALIFYVLGYNKKVACTVFFISFIPVGFRFLLFFMVVLPYPNKSFKLFNKVVLLSFLLLLLVFKLYSFSVQSIQNDQDRSIVTRYEYLVGS